MCSYTDMSEYDDNLNNIKNNGHSFSHINTDKVNRAEYEHS